MEKLFKKLTTETESRIRSLIYFFELSRTASKNLTSPYAMKTKPDFQCYGPTESFHLVAYSHSRPYSEVSLFDQRGQKIIFT